MKTKKLRQAVEDGTQTAVEYLTPYVEQALREGSHLADETYTRIRPALNDARIRGARIASDTLGKVQPVLDDALDKVSPAVDATVKKVKPAVDDVLQRIPPTVEFAREKVQEDFLPHLADALHDLARQPLAKELQVAAATAALAKSLDKASGRKKHSGWRVFGKVLLAGAALSAAVYAIRKLVADPSTGWENHTPKSAYVADPVAEAGEKIADVVDEVKDKAAEAVDQAKDKAEDLGEKVGEAVAGVKGKAKKVAGDVEEQLDKLADQAEGGDTSPLAGSPYGEGSYVGTQPPEGFTIKGNDRSMKYHIPGSAAYERTIAEVWFASEEAAQAAGYSRAQR